MHADIFRRQLTGRGPIALAVFAVVLLVGMLAPTSAWQTVAQSSIIQAFFALSVGLAFYRTGILMLCPLTFGMVGAWTMSWLHMHTSLPFVVMMVLATLSGVPVGLVIGGIAVRLRGIPLAALTLAFGTAMTAVVAEHPFPGAQSLKPLNRPSGFTNDRMYFLFCLVILAIVGLFLYWFHHSRSGRAWESVRFSERAAVSAGVSAPWVKLQTLVICCCIGALGGSLFVGQIQSAPSLNSFAILASLTLVAGAVMVGAFSLTGALQGGIFVTVIPEIFTRIHISANYPPILFGLGAVQALAQGAGGISSQLPWMRAVRSHRQPPLAPEYAAAPARAAAERKIVLSMQAMGVNYGQVVALDEVSVQVPERSIVGVIGPNGAGKSTFIDAMSGFIPYRGTISLNGRTLDGMAPNKRAKLGLRRTFQQGRAIPALTVGGYVELGAGRAMSSAELDDLLGFFALPPADEPISFVDVGTRRVIEIAAAVAAKPVCLLLDEPAAGLGEHQTNELTAQLAKVPERFDCSILLVEHHVEMVAELCSQITVLDFGRVLATGEPKVLLKDPVVAAAYLGEEISIEDPVAGLLEDPRDRAGSPAGIPGAHAAQEVAQ